jgi:hypothetical protein
MPSLREQFHHFYALSEDDTAAAMKEGLVAPDTNVLLNFYRYQSSAREQLAGALEKLGNRLWIPHQVGQEFHNRRLDVMADQGRYFSRTREEIMAAADALHGKVRAFGARTGLGPEYAKKIGDCIDGLKALISDEIANAQELNEVSSDNHGPDAILDRIDALFADADRVGDPMTPEELKQARAEADRRVREKIPPGYKDRGKADPAGDYLLWAQLITEAKKRQRPVILITDDGKEDWYQQHDGRTLGARRELRDEMMVQAGVPLLIMTTGTFLHHAGKYLDAEVSQETVIQARNLTGTITGPVLEAPVDQQARLQRFFCRMLISEMKDHLAELSDRDQGLINDSVRVFEAMAERGALKEVIKANATGAQLDDSLSSAAAFVLQNTVELLSPAARQLFLDASRRASEMEVALRSHLNLVAAEYL